MNSISVVFFFIAVIAAAFTGCRSISEHNRADFKRVYELTRYNEAGDVVEVRRIGSPASGRERDYFFRWSEGDTLYFAGHGYLLKSWYTR